MDYTGINGKKYRVNRKLTAEERANQFHQNTKLTIVPFYDLSVIRMNSTYLECVDRWFMYRGSMTALCLIAIAFPVVALLIPILAQWVIGKISAHLCVEAIIGCVGISIPFWSMTVWILTRESFRKTHFPIRFNHRNRMVYATKPNGTIITAKWRDIFFTLGRCERMAGRQNWDIRGHILDKDGETVLDTFALPGDDMLINQLHHVWEFFRRYMEDGPAAVFDDVFWCHDIAERRETYKAGLVTLFFCLNGQPIGQILLSPVFFLASLGRWFAMHTSKIPVWPEDVEDECKVDPCDPFRRDASNNPPKVPMEPLSVARSRIE